MFKPLGGCNICQSIGLKPFSSKWFSGSQPDEGTQEILRKLEEPSAKQNVKTVQGGVLIDMENADTYGEKHCKLWFIANAAGPVCCFLHLKFLLYVFRCWWNEIPSFVKCSKSFSRSRIVGMLYSLWQVCSVVLMARFCLFLSCSKNVSLSVEVRWLWSEVFVKHIGDSKNVTCRNLSHFITGLYAVVSIKPCNGLSFRQGSLTTTTSKNLARKLQCHKHSVSFFCSVYVFDNLYTSICGAVVDNLLLEIMIFKLTLSHIFRSGEWSFKNCGSLKLFGQFFGSCNLNFLRLCPSAGLAFLQSCLTV